MPGPIYRKNREKFCPKCKTELSKDFDIQLPPPIYFYTFLAECDSPWLHYGYCKPCLLAARSSGIDISEHIAICEGLVEKCWEGEHENLITHYKNTEEHSGKNSDQNENMLPNTNKGPSCTPVNLTASASSLNTSSTHI